MRKIESIWIEAEEWVKGEWTPADDSSDVIVTLDDGSRWGATCFSYRNIFSLAEKNRRTAECLCGRYFWASGMVLVAEVSRIRIEEIDLHLVMKEPIEFQSIFRRINETEDGSNKNGT